MIHLTLRSPGRLSRRACLLGLAGGPLAGGAWAWPLTGAIRYPAQATFGVNGGRPESDGGGFGDSPPGGHHVPDSQVFYSVPSAAPLAGAAVGGVIGALFGAAVAQGQASSRATPHEAQLRHRFDGMVRSLLDERLAALGPRYRRATDDGAADILLTPSLTVLSEDDSRPMMTFRLAVSFPNAEGGGRAFKAYMHDRDRNRPLTGDGGWLAGDAALLLAAARESFGKLLDLMFEDMAGAFDPVFEPETAPALRWRQQGDNEVRYGVLLRESEQHVLIAGQYRLAANPAAIRLVDRGLFSVAEPER
jgi:hypothetical protein